MSVKKIKTQKANAFNLRYEVDGLQSRVWTYFAIFAICIVSAVWGFNFIINNVSYKGFKLRDIRSATREIVNVLENDITPEGEERARLHSLASKASMETRIFLITTHGVDYSTVVFSSNPYEPFGGEDAPDIPMEGYVQFTQRLDGLYQNLISSEKDEYSETFEHGSNSGKNDEQLLVFCCQFRSGGSDYFYYASTPLLAQWGNIRLLSLQLLWVAAAAVIMALLTSYLLAKQLSSPIVNMSKEARKLAKGDYTAHFVGNGYNEIDELSEALNYATQEMNKIATLRKDVVANVSHDLKTPLTLIKSYAEMLKDFPDMPKEKKEQSLTLIVKETDRVTELVNEMVKLTLSERGDRKLEKQTFNFSKLVRSVADFFDVKKEEGYNFKAVIEEDLYINADKGQIQQVLYNFLTNAFAYTGEDKKVSLEVKDIGGVMRLDCYDSGAGLSEEDRQRVWDRFYRASGQHTRGQGTGLGLAICKNILQMHEAKFGVNSVVGKGSDFYFELPLAAPVQEQEEQKI